MRTLGNVNSETAAASGVRVVGDPDAWVLICKGYNDKEGWMKSTKAMQVDGLGVLVQVTTETRFGVAEALAFIQGAEIAEVEDWNNVKGDEDPVRFKRIVKSEP